MMKAPADAPGLFVIPGRCASIELWSAVALLRISRFPDAQLRI
jgi:hypothetical protein